DALGPAASVLPAATAPLARSALVVRVPVTAPVVLPLTIPSTENDAVVEAAREQVPPLSASVSLAAVAEGLENVAAQLRKPERSTALLPLVVTKPAGAVNVKVMVSPARSAPVAVVVKVVVQLARALI